MDKPAYFVRAMRELNPTLFALGYKLAEEHYHYFVMGSAFAVYRRRNCALQLVWDGREGALWAGISIGLKNDWDLPIYKDVEAMASGQSEAMPFDREQSDDRITRLAKAIETVASQAKPENIVSAL